MDSKSTSYAQAKSSGKRPWIETLNIWSILPKKLNPYQFVISFPYTGIGQTAVDSLTGDQDGAHVLRTPVLLSEALLAHDVYVCLECSSGALPPEVILHGVASPDAACSLETNRG